MPNSQHVQIVDAIVSELNDAARSWMGQFTAVRTWLPVYEITALTALKCTVVPGDVTYEKISRTPKERCRYQVMVGFARKEDVTAATTSMDALDKMVQDVHDFFRDGHYLATFTTGQVVDAQRTECYDLDDMVSQQYWRSQIDLTIEVLR